MTSVKEKIQGALKSVNFVLEYIVSFFLDQMKYDGMVEGIFRYLRQTILLPLAAD